MLDSWTLKMAWRDSRGSRRRLLLFLGSMVLGVAALVAINSFGANLRSAVDEQAKALLGADLSLESREKFGEDAEAFIDSLGGLQSRRISFASMALFPRTGDTRLATVRAQSGTYPYYGQVETTPAEAAGTYMSGKNALVDGTLMQQFGVQIGDSVRIGKESYQVIGRLLKTPRESEAIMLFSPRIYIPLAHLDSTLLQRGSRAEYEVYFKFEEPEVAEATVLSRRDWLRARKVRYDTVNEERENWDEALTNLYRFLSLVGFMALLLGSLGVASAVHVYIRQRVDTVAVLRCFGSKSWRTFRIYLIQAVVMGLLGSITGSLLGIGLQLMVPRVLSDFLPVDVAFNISLPAILLGLGIGLGVTVLFTLLPLIAVRKISPLRALRSSFEPSREERRDPLRWMLYAMIGLGISVFAVVQAPNWQFGLGYALGIGVVFGALSLVAKLIMVMTRKYFPSRWPYVWRQGLANLYRPNNQTLILMLALGLGTFLIMTLFLIQRTLLDQVEIAGGEGRPNLVFFDIQQDQIEGVSAVVRGEGLPVLDKVPIVTMRIASIKGESITAMRADSSRRLSWAHTREYRSSYRSSLTESETLVEGTFEGQSRGAGAIVPVSVEKDLAEELEVALGDTVVFDVQGVLIPTAISSIREVEWRRVQTNFFFVFPEGALEEAPQFFVLLTRTDSDATSGAVQAGVVRSFPNVSAIDLSLVLNVFDAIFSRIAFVIRFMALFSIITGLIVLTGAVVVSRFQRVEESVLLKTLGASRKQVLQIMTIEYLFLGLFATSTGLLLSLLGGWALAYFVFNTPLIAPPLAFLAALIGVSCLTIGIGLLNSRGIYDRPPLQVLRSES